VLTFQTFVSYAIWPYYWTAYRIRAFGRLPNPRGSTLCIANHQNDLDDKTISYLVRCGPHDKLIYSVSGRRLFERGSMGWAIPWLAPILHRADMSWLVYALGMLPIENETRARTFMGCTRAVLDKHGDLPLAQVFKDEALDLIGPDARDKSLSDVFKRTLFLRSRYVDVPLKWIKEPFLAEMITQMRVDMESDLDALEAKLKAGATMYLTPEGHQTRTGRLGRLREALWRLAPAAGAIYTLAISYDLFVGHRLSMLLRVVPAIDRSDIPNSMRAPRPVTVSQLLAEWFCHGVTTFTEAEAVGAVRERLAGLPPMAWVDPELFASPERMTRAAFAGLRRRGMLERVDTAYRLTDKRKDPRFPKPHDVIAHQAAFLEESRDAWRVFSKREG
jgi:1-acyl-sn-glycerol-3-phosphate acyltransferase